MEALIQALFELLNSRGFFYGEVIMAKDLPYFKFYSSEWNDGDITLEEMKTQGVFINVCSYYWSRECNLEESKLTKRFRSYTAELAILIDAKVITTSRGMVKISFLDKQWLERENKKATMKANGLKGGRPKNNQKLSDEETKSFSGNNQTITNKEEKREEEKRKELKNITKKFTAPTVEEVKEYCDKRLNSVDPDNFVSHYEVSGWMRGKTKIKDWQACVRTWEKNSSNSQAAAKTHYAGQSVIALNVIVSRMRSAQATTQDIANFTAASNDGFKPNE